MAGYQVNPAQLLRTAEEIRTLGGEPGRIRGLVNTADVPPHSWGMLGLQLGVYDNYRGLLTSLSEQLDGLQRQITTLGDNLHATGEQYAATERAASEEFDRVGKQRDDGLEQRTGNPGFAPGGTF